MQLLYSRGSTVILYSLTYGNILGYKPAAESPWMLYGQIRARAKRQWLMSLKCSVYRSGCARTARENAVYTEVAVPELPGLSYNCQGCAITARAVPELPGLNHNCQSGSNLLAKGIYQHPRTMQKR